MHRKTPALIFLLSSLLVSITLGSALAQSAPAKSQPALDVTSMDTSVDPCMDFFAYSCGGWIKQNPIPPDQSSWSVYSKLEDDNKAILREILESAATPAPDRDAVKQKIGDYYAACMDEKAINLAAIKPLQPVLDQIQQLHSRRAIADVAAIRFTTMPFSAFAPIRTTRTLRESSPKWTRVGLGCRTATKLNGCGRLSTRILRTNTAPMAWSQTCQSFRKRFTAKPARPW
jgi:hypothetical protein